MFTLEHRVRVFVYRIDEDAVRYLLVRRRPRAEWPLGPVIGAVGLGDHLEDAIRREVRAETGLREAHSLVELADPTRDVYGAAGLVEWPFAFQAGTPDLPPPRLQPGPEVGEIRWAAFGEAWEELEGQRDQNALLRLKLRLVA